MSRLRIGPAGWSYRDWEGVVYPGRVDQLRYLSRYFDVIEINSTFYGPASSKSAAAWVTRVSENEAFRFTAKLWQQATHTREGISPSQLQEWTDGIRPLQEAGRLGALLAQFPWSFKNTDESRRLLIDLLNRLEEFPRIVELRHSSWDEEAVRDLLRRLDVGLCNVDQPVIGRSLSLQAWVTSGIAYLRCHGRNYRTWFQSSAGRDQRYDYLYREEEIEQQAEITQKMEEEGARDLYVIYNNHFRGQAVVNALQLRRRLQDPSPQVPEPLLKIYPGIKWSD